MFFEMNPIGICEYAVQCITKSYIFGFWFHDPLQLAGICYNLYCNQMASCLKGDIYTTMCYMCSESEGKDGFDPSDIFCVCNLVLMIVPVPPKNIFTYALTRK